MISVNLIGFRSYLEKSDVLKFLNSDTYESLAKKVANNPNFACECISNLDLNDFDKVIKFSEKYIELKELSDEDKEDMIQFLVYRSKMINSKYGSKLLGSLFNGVQNSDHECWSSQVPRKIALPPYEQRD
jgi:hypothetical protein